MNRAKKTTKFQKDPLAGDLSDFLGKGGFKPLRLEARPKDTTVTLRVPTSLFSSAKLYAVFENHDPTHADYLRVTYNPAGEIIRWIQLQNGATTTWDMTAPDAYDGDGELHKAVKTTTSGTTPFQWDYDKAGNRTGETIDTVATTWATNNLNQLTSQNANAAILEGDTNRAVVGVTVNQTPVPTPGANQFQTQVPLASGANVVAIQASAADGAVTTNRYQINNPQAMTYDANGNLTSDGSRNFSWDSENRLVQVTDSKTSPATVTSMQYDGRSQRVGITAKQGTTTLSDKRYVWAGSKIAEERDGSGGTVTKRYYSMGVQQGGVNFYYATDHLRSVREVTDGAGAVRAEYDFDLWGRRTKLAGDFNADFGFTGFFNDGAGDGLDLTKYRGYDASLGRWLSRDPIGERGGLNLYGYVSGNPIIYTDRSGLFIDAGVSEAYLAYLALLAAVTAWELWYHSHPYSGTCSASSGSSSPPAVPQAANPPKDDPQPVPVPVPLPIPNSPDCEAARSRCLKECSHDVLEPGKGDLGGGAFRRCMHECMEAAGCSF